MRPPAILKCLAKRCEVIDELLLNINEEDSSPCDEEAGKEFIDILLSLSVRYFHLKVLFYFLHTCRPSILIYLQYKSDFDNLFQHKGAKEILFSACPWEKLAIECVSSFVGRFFGQY